MTPETNSRMGFGRLGLHLQSPVVSGTPQYERPSDLPTIYERIGKQHTASDQTYTDCNPLEPQMTEGCHYACDCGSPWA